MTTKTSDAGATRKIRVKYEKFEAQYANQTVLSGSGEEVFLDFSSGPVPDASTGEMLLPIHTRIAMTTAGARRLLTALQQTLKRAEASRAQSSTQRAALPSAKS